MLAGEGFKKTVAAVNQMTDEVRRKLPRCSADRDGGTRLALLLDVALAIRIVLEDGFALVAPIHDGADRAEILDPQLTGRGVGVACARGSNFAQHRAKHPGRNRCSAADRRHASGESAMISRIQLATITDNLRRAAGLAGVIGPAVAVGTWQEPGLSECRQDR
jgi:hypothetical protein